MVVVIIMVMMMMMTMMMMMMMMMTMMMMMMHALTSRPALKASSPLVGSSRKSTAGTLTSSMATATRRFSPPEMPLPTAAQSVRHAQWGLLRHTLLTRCSIETIGWV
jgi:hypothetical protein